MAEALAHQQITLYYRHDGDTLLVDGHREKTNVSDEKQRIFTASVSFL
jgi:hypothetical protein